MVFVFDTNSIRVLGNYYQERFPTFWDRFEAEVAQGGVVSVREVFNELQRQDKTSWIWGWVNARRSLFRLPTPVETTFVGEIFQVPHFRDLVGRRQQLLGQPVADPFVVAAAKACGGCVVTEEADKPNAAKVPNVCTHFAVDFTNVRGFLERKDWRF